MSGSGYGIGYYITLITLELVWRFREGAHNKYSQESWSAIGSRGRYHPNESQDRYVGTSGTNPSN
jgi:hypothetical protein